MPIWDPLEKYQIKFDLDLEKLPPIDSKPIDELVHMLEETKNKSVYKFSMSNLPYIVIAVVILIVLMVIVIICVKRHAIMHTLCGTVLKTILPIPSSPPPPPPQTVPVHAPTMTKTELPYDIPTTSGNIRKTKTQSAQYDGLESAPVNVPSFSIQGLDLATAIKMPTALGMRVTGASPRPRSRPQTTLRLSRRDRK